MKKNRNLLLIIVLLLSLLVFSACSLLPKEESKNNDNNANTTTSSYVIDAKYGLDLTEVSVNGEVQDSDVATVVANLVMPATVEIETTIKYSYTYSSYGGFFGGHSARTVTDSQSSKATGFFINSDGYLMTNAHVVCIENEKNYSDLQYVSRDIKINFADSDIKFEVEVVAYDEDLDLAILKMKDKSEIENIQYVTFFNMTDPTSDSFYTDEAIKLYYGEMVVAIGNANGYGISVTSGVVSAPYRTFTSSGSSVAAIQTDAAINEGNSGGPLANKYGAVIGINSFKTVTSTSESLGFAIPSYVIIKYIDYVASQKSIDIKYYVTNTRAY